MKTKKVAKGERRHLENIGDRLSEIYKEHQYLKKQLKRYAFGRVARRRQFFTTLYGVLIGAVVSIPITTAVQYAIQPNIQTLGILGVIIYASVIVLAVLLILMMKEMDLETNYAEYHPKNEKQDAKEMLHDISTILTGIQDKIHGLRTIQNVDDKKIKIEIQNAKETTLGTIEVYSESKTMVCTFTNKREARELKNLIERQISQKYESDFDNE
jgi:hypothetical protein